MARADRSCSSSWRVRSMSSTTMAPPWRTVAPQPPLRMAAYAPRRAGVSTSQGLKVSPQARCARGEPFDSLSGGLLRRALHRLRGRRPSSAPPSQGSRPVRRDRRGARHHRCARRHLGYATPSDKGKLPLRCLRHRWLRRRCIIDGDRLQRHQVADRVCVRLLISERPEYGCLSMRQLFPYSR